MMSGEDWERVRADGEDEEGYERVHAMRAGCNGQGFEKGRDVAVGCRVERLRGWNLGEMDERVMMTRVRELAELSHRGCVSVS